MSRQWTDLQRYVIVAAVPCCGPLPSSPSGLAATRAAVLAIYAEQDTRITASWPQAEEQLKKAGVPHSTQVGRGSVMRSTTTRTGCHATAPRRRRTPGS